MAGIELRLSDVDPPNPDPLRTIYRDIVNLPDPVKLGITIRYFNYDDVGLYFRITGEGTGYTFGQVDLGLLGTGANAYRNLDQFASRSKPSAGDLPEGEKQESIKLILRAYTDSGYTNLKWTFEKIVTVHWINSNDPAFTVDFLNNFDDGTVQGWANVFEQSQVGATLSLSVVTDYVLSTPYSLRSRSAQSLGITTCQYLEIRYRTYKSFTTPNKPKVFAIIDVRCAVTDIVGGSGYIKNLAIKKGDDVLVFIGKPFDTVTSDYMPQNKWMRIVTLLPSNTILELRVVIDWLIHRSSAGSFSLNFNKWMDDIKIISK